ncbi:serine hydrolase domain-containing protein [Rubrivirga sp. IMCC43871]|uniref:serine hydrolase domain-containing protein n=1 Tax=Rubrivirga sp. IMCC43871 TaxID=3391575 RepID=UPI00398F90D8
MALLAPALAALALTGGAASLGALRIPVLRLDQEPDSAARLVRLDGWLEQLHRSGKFNGNVLLARGDEILYEASYGPADLGDEHPLTPRSSFNLASVSKPFTAFAVVLLQHRGALRYDDPIAAYLPEVAYLEGVSIRHLLHHTAGLVDYMKLVRQHVSLSQIEVIDTQAVLDLLATHRPGLQFAPGRAFAYSNTGYVLLAEIVARASGQPFGTFLDTHVFSPLGMTDTAVVTRGSAPVLAQRVQGFQRAYGLFGGPRRLRDLGVFDGVVGDGGMYASARDVWTWHRALSDGCLVPPDAYAEAYRVGTLADGTQTGYGFGWYVRGRVAEHAGGWLGFATYLHRDLRDDGLIVALDNGSNALRMTPVGFRWTSIAFNLQHALSHL